MLVARLRKIADEEAHASLAAEFRERADMIEAGLDPRNAGGHRWPKKQRAAPRGSSMSIAAQPS